MRIAIQASDCPWCQRAALVRGFEALGHEVISNWMDPDVAFVFVGNGPYEPYLEAARDRSKSVIFNVLDIATHNAGYERYVDLYRQQLPQAARVTAISKFTQWQLSHYCGVGSEVIYYPMKPVFETGVKRYPFRALVAGRVNDPNKRVRAALTVLMKAGYQSHEVAVVGPETSVWGTYLGVVDDAKLNELYNSVDYVMMMSGLEGAGLPAIEGACVGAIPIVAPDLSTFNEFWAGSPMGLYYHTFTSTDAIVQTIRHLDTHTDEKAVMKTEMRRYADLYLRPKFDATEVARRIITISQAL